MFERYFQLKHRGSSISTEFRGALATFLTMSYILFANPAILRQAGVPFESAAACTALAAGIVSLLMGLISNFPLALASGMGLNSVVAFQIAHATGSWQTAMGLVVIDGLVVLALVLAGVRQSVMRAIPRDLRLAIGSGIGLFIAFIGLVNAKLVVVPAETIQGLMRNPGAPLPPVSHGDFHSPEVWVASAGLIITSCLMAKKFKGAVVGGILLSTLLAFALGITHLPSTFAGPSFAAAFQADIPGALKITFLPLLLSLILVDFFDTVGTVTAIAEQASLTDKNGNIPGLKSILAVDAVGASIGGWLGASSVTGYIESAAGVAEGARTGLHSVFVGLFFLASIFFAPLAGMVPASATAPALILVGFLMASHLTQLDYRSLETAIPAFITLITIPLTFSICHGIGMGFISFVLIKVFLGRLRDVHPLMIAVAALFLFYFVWGVA